MLSPDEMEDTVDIARECLESKIVVGDGETVALDFAEALVQLAGSCVVGVPCKKHGDAVHGREAEELREGIEGVIANIDGFEINEVRHELQLLLDEVDARDSLVFLEKSSQPCA